MSDPEGLREAFDEWVGQHGLIWFDTDIQLAEAIAAHLNISIDFELPADAEATDE